MWLLESDGNVFHGQQLWLRPGKRFIFGRTLRDAGGFLIENKTISRKHLVIEVGALEPGDAVILKKRSTVTLEDQNTKIGTLVNGEQIRGMRHTLKGDVHEIILGHYEHLFRITWQPVVLSFSFSKEFKAGNPVDSMCQQLNGLDIKVMLDVVRGSTTHVVAKKRNTPKVLEALISGCYIVELSFLDAVTKAAEQPEDGMSSLETDFRANWPNPENYLPPRGKEPTTRPNKDYYPNMGRQDVFDGYTFVFYEQAQFDNLLGPITIGRGKALLHQAEPSVTTVEEFVGYVRNVAGEKTLGEFEDGSEGKRVVVVKYQPAEGPTLSWYSDFGTRVSLQLDHRLILQNEFLDAILNNDASELRRPLEIEQSGNVAPSWTAGTTEANFARTTTRNPPSSIPSSNTVEEVPENSAPAAVLVRKLGRSRRAVTSRFKGFGGEFDTPSIPESSQIEPPPVPISQSQHSGMFVSQDIEVDYQISEEIPPQSRSSRKRPTPSPIEEEDEDDFLDQLAPSAANLKRRRLAEDVARRRRGDSTLPPSVISPQQQAPVQKTKKLKEQIDVLEVARIQREKEEEIARHEREALQEAVGEMDIDEIRKLAVIEEMEVRRSAPPPRATGYADDSERWDVRWNGRKDFKKFRRRGDVGVRDVNKVIIPLLEVKKKDFGIGDEYWLEGDKNTQQTRKKGKARAHDTERVSQVKTQPIRARSTRGRTAEVAEDSDVELLEVAPTLTQAATQNFSTAGSQTLTDKTKASVNKPKRAAEPITKPAPAKKPRQATRRAAIADSDDSDDGLGFKFRKKI